jgi:hypothetical protein
LRRGPYGSLALRLGCTAPLLILLIYAAAACLRAGVSPLALALLLVPVSLIATLSWYRQTILPRVTFDRATGLLALGWKGLRGRRPLSSVIGVQVMQTRKHFGGPELNIPAVILNQLNLILDDPTAPRLNVLTCDSITARSNAKLVADFLGVPVLDSAGTAADAAVAAATTADPMPTELTTVQSPAAAAAAAEPTPTEFPMVGSPVVTEPGPDVLLLRLSRRALVPGLRAMGSVVGMAAMIVLVSEGAAMAWYFAAVLGAICCFLFLLLIIQHRQARFDRTQGVLTLGRWLGRRSRRPLASVKAVEVADFLPGSQSLSLRLDPRQPQLTLILVTDADAVPVRRAAERLASFLGVPLLDTRRQTPAAAQSRGAATVNPLEKLNRSPLPPGRASIRGPARIVCKGEDVLVLRPRSRFWVRLASSLLTLGLALVVGWFAFPALLGQVAAWLTFVLVGAMAHIGLRRQLLYGDHFDRQARLLTLGRVGDKETYPLAKVLAIQLVPAGLVHEFARPFRRGGERVSYQLNLVLADTDQDRLNLTHDSDLEWARQAGAQLADFLGVPLIDQIADGD